MPDMTEAKKVVARHFRTIITLSAFLYPMFIFGIIFMIINPYDADGWKRIVCILVGIAGCVGFTIVFKNWRQARRDLKHGQLLSKRSRDVRVYYTPSGYKRGFVCRLIDNDGQKFELSIREKEARVLSALWHRRSVTIEYLESSRLAIAVYVDDISPSATLPKEWTALFEEREGYTRFVKGKKKEHT
jgi:uncharacterized membrane protein YuzA (DUF378 family)